MTDAETCAELERMDSENHLRDMFLVLRDRLRRDHGTPAAKVFDEKILNALRLLAKLSLQDRESQKALREIGDMKMRVVTVVTLSTDGTGEEKEIEGHGDSCQKIKQIAKNACKEG